jgi:hypothetical protein
VPATPNFFNIAVSNYQLHLKRNEQYSCFLHLFHTIHIRQIRTISNYYFRTHKMKRHTIFLGDESKSSPGIRYRELQRATGFANGVLAYHLKILEKSRRMKVKKLPARDDLQEHNKKYGISKSIEVGHLNLERSNTCHECGLELHHSTTSSVV